MSADIIVVGLRFSSQILLTLGAYDDIVADECSHHCSVLVHHTHC